MGGTQEGAPGLDCGDAEKKPAAQGQSRARATSAPVFKARCAVAWRTEGEEASNRAE